MEIDVAMEEPRARVVRREPNRNVIAGRAGADDIALRGVDVVVVGSAGGADNMEDVAVKVEGMRLAGRSGGHWEGDLDGRIVRESVDGAGGQELRRGE